MKKTIAIIPARGGSKRLPGKNVQLLGGIPLLAHSILFAKENHALIDAVYVSTNDAEIKKTALAYGAEVIDRPESIAGDTEPTVTALQHALTVIGAVENVILLQPTNPLRPENLLADCFPIFENGNYNSLFTVSRSHHKLGKIANRQFLPFNYEPGQRSQDLEPLYYENGLLYICKAELIREGIIMSPDAFPFIMEEAFAAVDIDTAADFEYADYLFQKLKHTK